MQKFILPELYISNDQYYPRPQVSEQLKKIFIPQENSRSCYIIYGKSGTGKSISIKMTSREVGQGVLYVDIPPQLEGFGREFAKAMNIDISWLPNKEQWKAALSAFERIAKVYKAKYGRPLVIVYDNVDQLISENTEILDFLQSSVTEYDNKRKYVAVFVCREFSVHQRISSRGHWTDIAYFEIGDLTKEESIDYLNKQNIKEEEAIKIYELVGGCILNLKEVVVDLFSGQSFEDIKKNIKIQAEKEFFGAALISCGEYYEVGRKITNALLNSKELYFSELWEIPNYSERDNELLSKNVFEYHPETHKITFKSKSVENLIRESQI
ncbi:hypothetical protein Glove_139g92 [Diversispora epigaea]|uniref:ORC1/DEAH AAA+ ATPase domain-containing protein n=1 Tax=Diversispora epigaea TaxID=1348612 RepID=A0A397IVQ3_9GLOM|nr:hypothetical protein Glove_139g92 [Diversispora epigaea]